MGESILRKDLPGILDDKEACRHYEQQIFFLLGEHSLIALDEAIKSRLMYTNLIADKITYCLDAYRYFKECIEHNDGVLIQNNDQSQHFFLKQEGQKSVLDIQNSRIGALSDFWQLLMENIYNELFFNTPRQLQKKYFPYITDIYKNTDGLIVCRVNTADIYFVSAPEGAGKKYNYYHDVDWYSMNDGSKIKELTALLSF